MLPPLPSAPATPLSLQPSAPANEDDELQRALALSMAEGGSGGGGLASAGGSGLASAGGSGLASAGGSGELAAAAEPPEAHAPPVPAAPPAPAAPTVPSPEEVKAEAASRLPAEPADGSGVRIGALPVQGQAWRAFAGSRAGAKPPSTPSTPAAAVRLPDGRRGQRRFPGAAPVAALYDFSLSLSDEAAGGRAFLLAQAMPGAPREPASLLGRLWARLQALAVAGARSGRAGRTCCCCCLQTLPPAPPVPWLPRRRGAASGQAADRGGCRAAWRDAGPQMAGVTPKSRPSCKKQAHVARS